MSVGAQHLHWDAERLWQRLDALLPGLSVEVVARCDSTNTQLLERARLSSGRHDQPITVPDMLDALTGSRADRTPHGRRAGDTQPCLLVAEQQTRGRGRQGRPWHSAAGASLTFSLALVIQPPDWSGLSLAVGVALADALDPLRPGQAPRIGLKWPNDLWLLDAPIGAGSAQAPAPSPRPGAAAAPADPGRIGRKLGGVLIETVAVGAQRMVVVGVGLNVLPMATRELAHGFACLQEIDPDITAPRALALVAEPLARALLAFEREDFSPEVAARYRTRDLLLGRSVSTTSAAAPTGMVEGVGDNGALRVRSGGRLHEVVSGDVSVRLEAR